MGTFQYCSEGNNAHELDFPEVVKLGEDLLNSSPMLASVCACVVLLMICQSCCGAVSRTRAQERTLKGDLLILGPEQEGQNAQLCHIILE